MKTFDDQPVISAEDMQFEVLGVRFTRRAAVRPETLATIEDAPYQAMSSDVVAQLDRGIAEFLIPEDVERWDELRTREDNPVRIFHMRNVARWLVEVESRLPTTQPSASTPGRSDTEQPSMAPSPSPEAIRAA